MVEKFNKLFLDIIFILNTLGVTLGLVWLAILGEWKLIGIGIFWLIFSKFILSLFVIPILPIAAIGMRFFERNNFFIYIFGFLSHVYLSFLMLCTCIFAFLLCFKFYGGEKSFQFIPYLLWSWGIALGPWQGMISKYSNLYDVTFLISLFSTSFFYFLFIISIFTTPIIHLSIFVIFVLFQLIILPIILMKKNKNEV